MVVNGRIIWVLDAYTTTNNYPYSQSIHPSDLPAGSGLDTDFNYVRNSVKATVDAYDGTVSFYVVDKTDPIINTYRKAFPDMFQDPSAMPAGLRDHWRYPEDVFDTQTEQYTQYHITDPDPVLQQAEHLGYRAESRGLGRHRDVGGAVREQRRPQQHARGEW